MTYHAGAVNDWQKDRQFIKLNAQRDKVYVKVFRDKGNTEVLTTEVVVGDVLLLNPGDKVCSQRLSSSGKDRTSVDDTAMLSSLQYAHTSYIVS